ncbi:uncharacterized protein LOC144662050 [Oculina patagonica]
MKSKETVACIVVFCTICMGVYWIIFNFDDLTKRRNTRFHTSKAFIYLTEAEQCLPPNLANSSQIGDPETCNCDVIVLSFKSECKQDNRSHVSYLFDPNTHFASGRNVLFFDAMDRRPGYRYYIFLDDDTILKYNRFTPITMKKLSPFRAVEKWLLDYEPAVGVLDYEVHHGASVVLQRRKQLCGLNETSLVLPTVFYDAIFNAFHHKAIEHILPYPTQYEDECWYASHRNTMILVEVKFPGQALMFVSVTAGNPIHRDYPKDQTNINKIMREFIERIRQEAPLELMDHVLFKQLQEDPDVHLSERSKSFCVKVNRHQPIIPYRHLLTEL